MYKITSKILPRKMGADYVLLFNREFEKLII